VKPRRPADQAVTSRPGGQLLGGRYELCEELARGGMGRVFAAKDRQLGRRVAVKLIASPSPTQTALLRFEQEGRALAAFNHQNILSIYDVGEHGGQPYLVFELLEGQTLRQRMSASPLSIAEALDLVGQIASGLDAAHEHGIVHRDLKPDNVFITRDGRVKLLDFGVAKLVLAPPPSQTMSEDGSASPVLSAEREAPRTVEGRAVGTVGYMAPEQVRGDRIDHRADLFSLGALFYELIASRRAFDGASARQIGLDIVTSEPPPLPPGTPRLVRGLIERCLEKDRGRRFQSAREVISEVQRAASELGPGERRRQWPWVAGAALSLALAAAGAFLASRRAKDARSAVVVLMPLAADAADAQVAAAIDLSFERALSWAPGVKRAGRDRAGAAPSSGSVLRGSLSRTGTGLKLFARFENAGGELLGEPIEAEGSGEELVRKSVARLRDEFHFLRRDQLRRERAQRLTGSRIAAEKLTAYYDLMGPSARLEFAARGRRLLDDALAADPADVAALSERSLLLRLTAGRDGEDLASGLKLAREDAERALQVAPRDAQALLAECLVARVQVRDWPSDRELETATSACSDAAQTDPQSAQAMYTLAQLYDQACEDGQLVQSLQAAHDRAQRFDGSWEGRVAFYLVSAALQRNHLQEADAFSSELLADEAEEDLLGALAPARRMGFRPLQGVHVLRATVLMRKGRDGEAEAQLEAELARGASAVGGLDEAVEAASLRGLARLAQRRGRALDGARAAQLASLEERFRLQDARRPGPSEIAGWYGFAAPEAAVEWLERYKPQQGCGVLFQRAVFYRDAGQPERAARALAQCTPSEEWARRCVRAISSRLQAR
jgi:hypothetical protein